MLAIPIISEETANQTLISFLKKRLQTTPLSLIYKLFRTKKIKVNDKDVRYYHYRLNIGDEVKIFDNSLKISDFNISPTPKKVETNFNYLPRPKHTYCPKRTRNNYAEFRQYGEVLFVKRGTGRISKTTARIFYSNCYPPPR